MPDEKNEENQQREEATKQESTKSTREGAKGRKIEVGEIARDVPGEEKTPYKEKNRLADPLLVIAYMLVYLEIAWLIIVVVRSALAL